MVVLLHLSRRPGAKLLSDEAGQVRQAHQAQEVLFEAPGPLHRHLGLKAGQALWVGGG